MAEISEGGAPPPLSQDGVVDAASGDAPQGPLNDAPGDASGDAFAAAIGLAAAGSDVCLAARGAEAQRTPLRGALTEIGDRPVIVCHRAFTARRLITALRAGGESVAVARRFAEGLRARPVFDVLELFAFARPGAFCAPSAQGLAAALAGPNPNPNPNPSSGADDDEVSPGELADPLVAAAYLRPAARLLLAELPRPGYAHARRSFAIAQLMARAGWPWGPAAMEALSRHPDLAGAPTPQRADGLNIWTALPEWEERAGAAPPGSAPVDPEAATALLGRLIKARGGDEERDGQRRYAGALTHAFAPKQEESAPPIALAEAGTGVGKTLGYIAPSVLWAKQNGAGVWISTFTKALQRQLAQELTRVRPALGDERLRWAVRKGRENYLCLLNFQEAAAQAGAAPADIVRLGLIARWALASADGDMVGGDFPPWLAGPGGEGASASRLTDRRGECVHSACPHYRVCFVERTARAAKRADIVVANHALVLSHAAQDQALARLAPEAARTEAPRRYVFDEGHHLFAAADAAFAAHLSGGEMAELRRWVRGAEGGRRGRALTERIGDLFGDDEGAADGLQTARIAAAELPGDGWRERVAPRSEDGATLFGEPFPVGAGEAFLAAAARHTAARSGAARAGTLEAGLDELAPALVDAATRLAEALGGLQGALKTLAAGLFARLRDEAGELETADRTRIDAAARGLLWRAEGLAGVWRDMLAQLAVPPDEAFVLWFEVAVAKAAASDIGLRRHYVNPAERLAEDVLLPAGGAVITSATLRDAPAPRRTETKAGGASADETAAAAAWASAERRLGLAGSSARIERLDEPSPFDYGRLSRVLVVTDVNRDNPDQIAGAYRALFAASGGGGLGLFTAIARLRAVHGRLIGPMAGAGLALYAQHVDAMETGALLDVFRTEEDACLLGTDAVRDGVDVPGRSLRLIVLDRTPWARPDILHKARRAAFGSGYDDMIVRSRLKQAFGRLIRRADDRGVFVMLDTRAPSRLMNAFPDGVAPERMGLAEACAETARFLGDGGAERGE